MLNATLIEFNWCKMNGNKIRKRSEKKTQKTLREAAKNTCTHYSVPKSHLMKETHPQITNSQKKNVNEEKNCQPNRVDGMKSERERERKEDI